MRSRVRAGLRGVGLLAAAAALCTVAGTPASAEPAARWQPDISQGQGNGVVVEDGAATFDPATAHRAPVDESTSATEGGADSTAVPAAVPTGMLTLPERTLDRPTSEVSSTVDATAGPGSAVTLDVRGRRAGGGWTEWIPSEAGTEPGSGTAELPEPVQEVQGRLVLSAAGDDRPSVRGVSLTAAPSAGTEDVQTEAAPLSYSVFATREGLVGGTTANGHRIVDRDRFVALPSRRALSPNGRTDYSVKVCAPNGRCAIAPVWDIGPWNTKDDYWNPSAQREMWKDLPQGVPQAAAARNGHNGGKDQFGRRPSNPAGIDLGDGIFWDALGLRDNSQVQVEYLWTGNVRLSRVSVEGALDVPLLSAPEEGAAVVGMAVDTAEVPVQCRTGSSEGGWLQVGEGLYLPASSVESTPTDTPACDDSEPGTPGDTSDPAAATAPAETGPTTTSDPAGSGPTAGSGPLAEPQSAPDASASPTSGTGPAAVAPAQGSLPAAGTSGPATRAPGDD